MDKGERNEPVKGSMRVVVVAPVHLKKLSDICATLGKTRDTVKSWYGKGAPIAYDGVQYSAEYNQLVTWLVNNFSKKG